MNRTEETDYTQALIVALLIIFAVTHSVYNFELYYTAFKEMFVFMNNLFT